MDYHKAMSDEPMRPPLHVKASYLAHVEAERDEPNPTRSVQAAMDAAYYAALGVISQTGAPPSYYTSHVAPLAAADCAYSASRHT